MANNNKTKFWIGLIIAFVLGWGASYFFHTKSLKVEDKPYDTEVYSSLISDDNHDLEISSPIIPDYVLETLEYVLEHNEAPSGYVGGRIFQNRENQLPKLDKNGNAIQYREWDVHPKRNEKNRGAERLVTSKSKNAYYTSDHYQSFTKIQ